MRRRTTRTPRCKHNFIRLFNRTEPDDFRQEANILGVTIVRGRKGVVLACSTCGHIRTLWSDGTMHDGPIERIEHQRIDDTAMAVPGGTIMRTGYWDTTVAATAATPITNERLDATFNSILRNPSERPGPMTAARRADSRLNVDTPNAQPNGDTTAG